MTPPADDDTVCYNSDATNYRYYRRGAERGQAVYRSELRETAATANRSAIRDAATALFVEQGYAATTVREIARVAGVSVRTVFNGYPDGKAQIFDEALDFALGGDDSRLPLADRAVTRNLLAETHPDRVVERLADGALELYDARAD